MYIYIYIYMYIYIYIYGYITNRVQPISRCLCFFDSEGSVVGSLVLQPGRPALPLSKIRRELATYVGWHYLSNATCLTLLV